MEQGVIFDNTEHMPISIYYSPSYTAAGYAFDTTRKAGWIADSLASHPVPGTRLVAPDPVSYEQIAAIHDAHYVEAVRTGIPRSLAESNGFAWDPGLWDAVCASNGGAVAAALDAFRTGRPAGSLSSGLHHAARASGAAFCTFNGLALAARAVLDEGGESVLILDLDAHPGDGTVDIVSEWPAVTHADIVVSPWMVRPRDPSRCSSDTVRHASDYLPTLERRLAALEGRRFDLCLYNAGMDPHEDSAVGGLGGITLDVLREREARVFAWASSRGIPIAFVLAGGYVGSRMSRETLVALHRCTIEAAAAAAHSA
jgi:acetoin utilization deacetylase AcuC-like enzyme